MEALWVGASAPQRGTPGALNTPTEQGALVCSDLRISAKSLLIESKGRGWSRGLSLKMLAWCGHLPQPIVQGCKETKAPDSVPSPLFLSTVTPLRLLWEPPLPSCASRQCGKYLHLCFKGGLVSGSSWQLIFRSISEFLRCLPWSMLAWDFLDS